MDQNPYSNKIENNQFNFKKSIGIMLIILGIIGVLWIAYCILSLFQMAGDNPSNVPIVGTFLKYYEIDNTIKLPNGVIELPKVFFFISGLFLYFLILVLIEGISRTLLTTGTNLLENELTTIAKKFKRQLSNLKEIISKNR